MKEEYNLKRRNLLRIFLLSIFTFTFGWIIKKESDNTTLKRSSFEEFIEGNRESGTDEIKLLREWLADTERKMSWVNPTDYRYGAKGDGITDDTIAIQLAIDSLKNTGGKVILPNGTYIISAPLKVPSNVELCGQNRWTCIVKLKDTAPNLGMLVKNSNATVGSNTNITICNLTFDGNKSNNKSHPQFNSNFAILDFYNVKGLNIKDCSIKNSISLGIAYHDCTTVSIIGNEIYGTFRDGITGFGGLKNVIIANNQVHNTGDDCIAINAKDGKPQPENVTITGNSLKDIDQWQAGRCIKIGGARYFTVTGNTIDSAYFSGIIINKGDSIAPTKGVIQGNTIFNTGKYAQSAKDFTQEVGGVWVENASFVTIQANEIHDTWGNGIMFFNSSDCKAIGNTVKSTTKTNSRGIEVAAISKRIIINNNHVSLTNIEGIYIGTNNSYIACSGNTVINSGQGESNKPAISMGTVTAITLVGNICYDDQTTKTQNYGIYLGEASGGLVVTNNNCLGNIAAGINQASSSANNRVVANNIGTVI